MACHLVDGAFWLIGVVGGAWRRGARVLDFRTIPRGALTFATARTHLTLNAAAAVLFAAGYAWRLAITWHWTRPMGPLALSAVAVAFIAATWLGGKLTYCHGMRVTRQADRDEGTTRHG